MELKDVKKVTQALNAHLTAKYAVHIKFNEAEVQHFLIPQEQVVNSYVVQADDGTITDFWSFYTLNSSVLQDPNYKTIFAAYAFYNFVKDDDPERI